MTSLDQQIVCSDALDTSLESIYLLYLLCDPCSEDGQSEEAEGYCVDCSQYLCVTCFQYHCRPKPCRNHQLLDKLHMPKDRPTTLRKDECKERCNAHTNKVVVFYCEDHDQFGCSVCVALDHRNCEKLGYIPNLSEKILDSKEYLNFKNTLDELIQMSDTIQTCSKRNIEGLKSKGNSLLNEIRAFRKKIDDHFDKLEKELVDNVINFQSNVMKKMTDILKQSETLSTEMMTKKKDIDEKESNHQTCCLFMATKLQKLTQFKEKLVEMESNNYVPQTCFIESSTLCRFLQDESPRLGLCISVEQMCDTVSLDGENKLHYVTGITPLTDGLVALVDYKKQSLKIFDTHHNTVFNSNKLGGFLWGIAKVCDDKIAVVRSGDIEIYSVTGEIKLKKTIQSTGLDSFALVYSKDLFIGVTSSSPPMVQILNMNGDKIRSFPKEKVVKIMFENPWYIAVNPDNTAIYVSDCGINSVTCFSFEGELKAECKLRNNGRPQGIAVSRDGTVYVCDNSNHCIHILDSCLQEMAVINEKILGLQNPYGLAYCDKEHKLYVGSGWGNGLRVLYL